MEKTVESGAIIADVHGNFDPEHIWGGEEWEWKNWENAKRDMNYLEYNSKQVQEANSMKTREAFMMVEGREPIMNKDEHGNDTDISDELIMFFTIKKGARYFKRRNFQYRSDVPSEQIAKYYQNKEWEIEKDGASGF
jgi:hypothetical protein